MPDSADVIRDVCAQLAAGARDRAAETLKVHYPFQPSPLAARRYTPFQAMRVFLRDGLRDRYSGQRLIHPAALRFIGALLPTDFPMHPHWKQSECHTAFWELAPTLDHIVPIARGGEDAEPNWVTTSMLRNSAKANALLEEIGWELHPPGRRDEWDGLTGWIIALVDGDPALSAIPEEGIRHRKYIATWVRASVRALASLAEEEPAESRVAR